MNIQITTQAVQNVECDALIVVAARRALGKGEHEVLFSSPAMDLDNALDGVLSNVCADGEFKGNLGELLTLHTMGRIAPKRVIVVGLGTEQKIRTQTLRFVSQIAAHHAQNIGVHQVALAVDWGNEHISVVEAVQAQVEGAMLGAYTFRQYQHAERNGTGITQFLLVVEQADELEQAMRRGQPLAEATNFARDLVNEPPNVLTPRELAHRASTMAKQFALECEILDKPKMEELGMGGLLAVTQGSAEPPQFIILRYRGSDSEKGMALVGKGITFDTGGISIKPADHMEEMKGDMAGAAAVLGAMQAIATLRPAINVTALIPTCENMPSGTAYRPGDILRIMNGKTIEIVNTDAEGRLILADALSYAVKQGLSPIIDLATLTGGIVVALGHTMTGLFCNSEQLTKEILTAGEAAGEKFWSMPLDEEYSEMIKSDIADIKQSAGRVASSVTAAKILQHFVGNARWAHLDIAGTSYVDSKRPYQEKGATGVGVRTLVELAVQRAS